MIGKTMMWRIGGAVVALGVVAGGWVRLANRYLDHAQQRLAARIG
jgi:hypothetical protein